MTKIAATDVQGMVSHWLDTPVNGYLGSDYGSNVPDLLQSPQRTGSADAVLDKLKNDLPLLTSLPRNAVNMYAVDTGPDQRKYYIDISGQAVEMGNS